jgi:hypothetical protein
MEEQQSQKRGIRSDAQKTARARQGYEPIPPAQPVAGAFGEHSSDGASDQDVALRLNEKRATQTRNESQDEE